MGLMDEALDLPSAPLAPAPATPPPAPAAAPAAKSLDQIRAEKAAYLAKLEAEEKAAEEAAKKAAAPPAPAAEKAPVLLPVNCIGQGLNGMLVLKGTAAARYCVAAHLTPPADGLVQTTAMHLQHYGCAIGPAEDPGPVNTPAPNPGPNVLPSDTPKSDPAKAADPIPADVLSTLPPAVQAAVAAHAEKARPDSGVIITATSAPVETPHSDVTSPAEPEKAKRGRPKKSEPVQDHVAEARLEVYADCLPPEAVVSLEPWIGKLMRKMAEQAGLPDIRLAPDGHGLAFGKWKAALEAKAAVESKELGQGAYFVVVGADEARAAVVRGLASVGRVVRGMRAA